MIPRNKNITLLTFFDLIHFPLKKPNWIGCNNQLRPSFIYQQDHPPFKEIPYYLLHPFHSLLIRESPSSNCSNTIKITNSVMKQLEMKELPQNEDYEDWVVLWDVNKEQQDKFKQQDKNYQIKYWNDFINRIEWEKGIVWDSDTNQMNLTYLLEMVNNWDFHETTNKEQPNETIPYQNSHKQLILEEDNYLIEYTIDDPPLPLYCNCWMEEDNLLGLCLCTDETKIILQKQLISQTDFILTKKDGHWKIEEFNHLYSAGQVFLKKSIDIPPAYSGEYSYYINQPDSIQKRVLSTCDKRYGGMDAKRICEELLKTKEKWRNESQIMEEDLLDLPWNRCWIDGNLVEGKKRKEVQIVELECGKLGYKVNWNHHKRKKEQWTKLKEIRKELKLLNAPSWTLQLKHDESLNCLKRIKKRKMWNEQRQVQLTEEEKQEIHRILYKQRRIEWCYKSIWNNDEDKKRNKEIKLQKEQPKKRKKSVKECIQFILQQSEDIQQKKELEKLLKKVKRKTIKGFSKDIEDVIAKGNRREWVNKVKELIQLYTEE
ncbi:hypothetical protein ENUP19_0018G0070 [Entamoeba nuttalli]|uniref:Uncharacterized protein n=2 Tax=Entamoeba nuttalli TaxID=412467 RepID=K2GU51_ENTNP|nr:hypothetical protein ENU1_200010 [Entamoeba nuttalli P19]EKE37372.1 hypothetical protein ENU1_200010 [Entamoeba nuttalli P19]|eukprot:XP_008860302.1 hypothetical protein ENU1_200010 [Entamoeba nuttalli P19]